MIVLPNKITLTNILKVTLIMYGLQLHRNNIV